MKTPNPPSAAATILSAEERDEANTIGAYHFIRSRRYRKLREEHIFAALDANIESMKRLKFPNPYEGRILGALARELIRNDPKSVGYLRKRGVKALDDPDRRHQLFTFIGMLAAENYLQTNRKEIPKEPLLTSPAALLEGLGEMFDEMRNRASQMASVNVLADEMAVTFTSDEDEELGIARALVEDAVVAYESIAPMTDEENEVPNAVQRKAISKAAFMTLGAKELGKLAEKEGFDDLPNKTAIAEELATKYGDDLDKVAKLVVRRTEGDPEFGLVTRIMPLTDEPDLDAVATAVEALGGRYFEARPATFFVFGSAHPTSNTLRVTGSILSFTVNPAEAGGKAQVNFRPHKQKLTITLRANQPWVEVNTRRASDLAIVRSVLRRTGEVAPALEVPRPSSLSKEPFSTWDTRTLWLLDFIRRDLQAPELRLDDTVMANFISPESGSVEDEDERTPNVDSVRLRGRQLQDHQETCTRIADRAQLRDVEIRLRKVTDLAQNYSKLVRFQISWERDHLAVSSGADEGGDYDTVLHREVVGLVRAAARRELDEDGLALTLRRIERKATGDDGEDEAVFDAAAAS